MLTDDLKVMEQKSNLCIYSCLIQMLGILFNKILFSSVTHILALLFDPGNTAEYPLRSSDK